MGGVLVWLLVVLCSKLIDSSLSILKCDLFCLVILPIWFDSGAEKSYFGRYGEVRKRRWTPLF